MGGNTVNFGDKKKKKKKPTSTTKTKRYLI